MHFISLMQGQKQGVIRSHQSAIETAQVIEKLIALAKNGVSSATVATRPRYQHCEGERGASIATGA